MAERISPLGHQHGEISKYTNFKTGVTATFQWDGIRQVYDNLAYEDPGIKSNITTQEIIRAIPTILRTAS